MSVRVLPPLVNEESHAEMLNDPRARGAVAACQVGEAAHRGGVVYVGDCRGCRAAAMANAVGAPFDVVESNTTGQVSLVAGVRRMLDAHGEDGERLIFERELTRRGLAIT